MSACQRPLRLVFYNYLCVFSAKNVDKHSMKPILDFIFFPSLRDKLVTDFSHLPRMSKMASSYCTGHFSGRTWNDK